MEILGRLEVMMGEVVRQVGSAATEYGGGLRMRERGREREREGKRKEVEPRIRFDS